MTNLLWIRIVSRTVFALNILFLVCMMVVMWMSSRYLPNFSFPVLLATVLSILLSIAAGALCVRIKKNVLCLGFFVLFFFLSSVITDPLANEDYQTLLVFEGISLLFLTYWTIVLFSKWNSRFGMQASVFLLGCALLLLLFVVSDAHGIYDLFIYVFNFVAVCLVPMRKDFQSDIQENTQENAQEPAESR